MGVININIYLLSYNESLNYDLEKYIELLPYERKKQVLAYKFKKDKDLCILSYLLLRHAIKLEMNINSRCDFIKNKYGKPYFKGIPNVYFSISHCDSGIVCGISNIEIGVDIQDVKKFNQSILKIACCREEIDLLLKGNNKEELFFKMWSIKESYIKADGRGVNIKISDINTIGFLDNCISYNNMFVSACYKYKNKIGIVKDIKMIEVNIEGLQ